MDCHGALYLLPEIHLRAPVLRVTMCHDSKLVQDVREVTDG